MINILNWNSFNEGKHGKYEIHGKKDGKEQILDYASNPETAENIRLEWEDKGWETFIKE